MVYLGCVEVIWVKRNNVIQCFIFWTYVGWLERMDEHWPRASFTSTGHTSSNFLLSMDMFVKGWFFGQTRGPPGHSWILHECWLVLTMIDIWDIYIYIYKLYIHENKIWRCVRCVFNIWSEPSHSQPIYQEIIRSIDSTDNGHIHSIPQRQSFLEVSLGGSLLSSNDRCESIELLCDFTSIQIRTASRITIA